jgi:hypothetical protein
MTKNTGAIILQLETPKACENFEKNAMKQGRPELAVAGRKRKLELLTKAYFERHGKPLARLLVRTVKCDPPNPLRKVNDREPLGLSVACDSAKDGLSAAKSTPARRPVLLSANQPVTLATRRAGFGNAETMLRRRTLCD